ncbi:hypothetical protein [Chryseobacterium gambrini]|uniref:hypothetical protein n=1 Tax=Chryseobacterium gambrini TaxID=373672 RepID=UPI0022F14CE4|nr:hypothetical protein [Chryseobacterium gambrini]WBV52274.1 hypothetical protein PFY09_18470 [Chryseobacterium gambrini]
MKRNLFLSVCLLLFYSCNSSKLSTKESIDIKDSIQVSNFVINSGLCDKLRYIEDNKNYFSENIGYSSLIIFDINKKEKTTLNITLGNKYRKTTKEERKKQVQDYIDNLKNRVNCNKPPDLLKQLPQRQK